MRVWSSCVALMAVSTVRRHVGLSVSAAGGGFTIPVCCIHNAALFLLFCLFCLFCKVSREGGCVYCLFCFVCICPCWRHLANDSPVRVNVNCLFCFCCVLRRRRCCCGLIALLPGSPALGLFGVRTGSSPFNGYEV